MGIFTVSPLSGGLGSRPDLEDGEVKHPLGGGPRMSVMALGLGSKGLRWALEFTHLLGPQFPHQRNGTGMGALILFFGTIISIKTPVLIPKFKIGGCYWVFTSVATGHFSVSLKILALVFPEDLGTPDFPVP